VRLTGDEMRTEFVCIPRPINRSERPDGGPLRYRVAHVAKLWDRASGRASSNRCLKATSDCRSDGDLRRRVVKEFRTADFELRIE
jgi:hypothetical protein